MKELKLLAEEEGGATLEAGFKDYSRGEKPKNIDAVKIRDLNDMEIHGRHSLRIRAYHDFAENDSKYLEVVLNIDRSFEGNKVLELFSSIYLSESSARYLHSFLGVFLENKINE